MRILLHICCAPCALMPVRELLAQGHELMGLWYNPNVHPYTENKKRLDTLTAWAEEAGLALIVQDEYPLEKWLRRAAHRESLRCGLCYHDRLTRAAQVAKRGRFDAFTSSLLYSVQQKHDLVAQTGAAVSAEKGVPFLYQDFRPFWKEGIVESKELGLYRQPYCGCVFSERDRYLGPNGKKAGPSKTAPRD